jgi:hypothetical protein
MPKLYREIANVNILEERHIKIACPIDSLLLSTLSPLVTMISPPLEINATIAANIITTPPLI